MTFWLPLVILFVIFVAVKLYLSPPTRWCRSQRCLVGKTVLVTGANTGIGYESALDFAKRGARVILGCRNPAKGEEARRKIIEATDNPNIIFKIVDFTSFDSVRAFARELNNSEEKLDILLNNAGMAYGNDTKTKDGYDIAMQVNYYSHFLLTNLLLGLMARSGKPSRVVNVSSLTAQWAVFFDIDTLDEFIGDVKVYWKSKLCNILFTKELARRLQGTNITTYSVHPGAIKTDILKTCSGVSKVLMQTLFVLFYKATPDGAQTSVYCSVEKGIEGLSGHHFDNCRRVADYNTATVPGRARKLWEITERIVRLQKEEKFNFDKS